jgi:hypothetical protein
MIARKPATSCPVRGRAVPHYVGAMVLLGRDRLLTWATGAWREAVAGRGRVLLLTGEAGIGKTTLARAIAEHAARDTAAAPVLRWGSCWDGGRIPLAAWTEALRAPGGDSCAAVAARLGERRVDDRADPAAAEQARLKLLTEVIDALRADAGRRPQLVVLDDLHWADDSSLLLLRAIAAHVPTMRALVVGTYRDDEVPSDGPLTTLGGGAEHLALSGLAEADVGRLLAEVLDREPSPQEQRDVHRQTAGNPLFVSHVGRLLEAGSTGGVPRGIADVLARRLARLPSESDRVLGAASVLGLEFDVTVVAQILDESREATLDALDHAATARVAAPVAGGTRQWAFTHALVQASRYDSLGSVARADLHRRAFDALSARATPAAVLSHHGARGRFDADDARPARAMLAAGDQAASRFAGDDATTAYGQALTHAPAGSIGDEIRAQALLGIGRMRLRRGDATGAGDAFEESARLARVLRQPELLAHAALGFGAGLGGFEVRMLDRRQAELLDEAASTLAPTSPLRPWVLARLSCALTMLGSDERRLELADTALATARAVDDHAAVAAALASRCDVIAGPAHVAERVVASEEIIAIGERLADRGIELLGRRYRVVALAERCDFRGLDAEIARFERTAALLDDPLYSWYVPLWRAMRAFGAGRLDDALVLATEARRIGTRAGSENARVLPLVVELYVALALGDHDALRRLSGLLVGDMASLLLANGTPMLLWVDVLFGATDAAARLRRLVDDVDRALAVDAEWLGAMAPLADLVFELGLDDLAAPLYERLAPHSQIGVVEGIAAIHRGPTARWLALLAAQTGDGTAVDNHIAEALALSEGGGALALADVQRAAARALRRFDAEGHAARIAELERSVTAAMRALGIDAAPEPAIAPAVTTAAAAGLDPSLVRQGDSWTVSWQGVSVQVRHAKGIGDLAALLEVPGRDVHVRELEGGARPAVGGSRGGPALDGTALAQYRRRLRDLEADLEEADRFADAGRAARLSAERDALVAELTRAVGTGGRVRRAGSDPDERQRKAVSARVKASIERIEAMHPPLGRHLRASIRTGFWCAYEPEHPVAWRVER